MSANVLSTILLNTILLSNLIFISIKWRNTTVVNTTNVKLLNLQLNKWIKKETEVVLRLSSDMVGDGETNFPHKLLLTDRQVTNICGNWY